MITRTEQYRRRFPATWAMAVCLLLCAANLNYGQQTNDASNRSLIEKLPPSTLAFAHTGNIGEWRKAFEQCRVGRIADSAPFKPFVDNWRQVTRSDSFAKRFGLTIDDLESLGSEQVAIVWLPKPAGGIGTALVVETQGSDSIAETMQAISTRFAGWNYQKTTATSGDHSTDTYTAADGSTIHIASLADRLIIARDSGVMAQLNGPTQLTIANDPGLKFVRERMADSDEQPHDLIWFVRTWQFLDASDRKPTNLDLAKSQGLQAIQSVGGRLRLSDEDIATYDVAAYVSGPLQKTAAALTTNPVKIAADDWIKEAFDQVQVIGFDPAAVLKGYGSWFDATEGEGETGIFDLVLEEIRDEPDGPQVDMRADVFDQMQSPFLILRMEQQPDADEPPSAVVAVKVKEPQRVSQAIGRMLEGDPDVSVVNIAGTKAWLFGDLSRGGTRQILGPDLTGVTICILDDHLLASLNKVAIKQALEQANGPQPTFNSSKRLVEVKKLAGSDSGSPDNAAAGKSAPVAFRYSRTADWLKPQYEQLRNGLPQTQIQGRNMRPAAAESRTFWSAILTSMRDSWVTSDVQQALGSLPSPDQLHEVLGPSLDVAWSTEEGHWILKGVLESPPNANANAQTKSED